MIQKKKGTLSLEQFKVLLKKVDSTLTTLPQTAQVASQQGRYLGRIFNEMARRGEKEFEPLKHHKFIYNHLGSFAYIGMKHAVAELPGHINSGGFLTWWLWRSAFLSEQVSWRTRVLVAIDWLKTILFGRDISKF